MQSWHILSEPFLKFVKSYMPNFNRTIMPKAEYVALRRTLQKKVTQRTINMAHQTIKQKNITSGCTVKFGKTEYKVSKITNTGKVQLKGKKCGPLVSPMSCDVV